MTYNPHDAHQQIIRRSKKLDKELTASIELAHRYDLTDRYAHAELRDPMVLKVFIDERSKPVYVSEQEHQVEYNRRGKWITVREV